MKKLNKFLNVILTVAMLCSVFTVTGSAMAVSTDKAESVGASTDAVAS